MTPEESKELADSLLILAKYSQPIRPYLLSVPDAAKVLGLSRRIMDSRVIPQITTIRVGTRRLVPTVELDRYIATRIAETKATQPVNRVSTDTADRIRRLDALDAADIAKARADRKAA